MRNVSIIGVGMTKFGDLDKGLIELSTKASSKAIKDSNCEKE